MMKKPTTISTLFFFCFVAIVVTSFGQEQSLSDMPKKGSYLYYPQPAFEDNSFLLEEAFNQPMSVIQNIFNYNLDNIRYKNAQFSFTQEIPLTDLTHQLSYTFVYNFAENPNGGMNSGFGDMNISYRPMLLGEKDWAMVIPRFTLIIPTGKSSDGLGNGAPGFQFNMAVTKRPTRKLVTHLNAGFTYLYKSDRYSFSNNENKLAYEHDLLFENVGASIIWYPVRKANLMVEYISNFISGISEENTITRDHQQIINPAFRFCIDNGKMQIVPGIGLPIQIMNGKYDHTGLFFYLSFEPDYLAFGKPKSR
jgi:hypothetical protein